jgi:lipopolysaccharide/colanic/teichoic acid biosynthesis glycosyltransferase
MTDIVQPIKTESVRMKNRLDSVLKRLFDLSVALLSLFILSPFFLVIAWLVRRDSPGPVFYHGLRAGRNAKSFRIHKFRTMYEEPASYTGPKLTANGDGRITHIGKWLRQNKLNELPQLWNVLVGEMSLVGPRPEDVDIAATWPQEIRCELLSVRPGITSPATIIYRNEEEQLNPDELMHDYLFTVLPSKLRLDLLYVRYRSIITDIDVILWTAIGLLPAMRQSDIPQNKLIFGSIAHLYSHYLRWLGLDYIVSFLSISLAGVIWRLEAPLNLGFGLALLVALVAALAFSLLNFIFGLHRVEWSRAPWQYVFPLAVSSALAVGMLVGLNVWQFDHFLPNSMLILSGFLGFIGFTVLRYRERLVTGAASRWINLRGGAAHSLGERVLVVGAEENFSLANWLLNRSEWVNAYTIIGLVDDNPRHQNRDIEGYRVIGTTTQIPELVKKLDIGLILFTMENILPDDHRRIIKLCRQTGVQIVMLPASIDHFRMQMRNGCEPSDLEQDIATPDHTQFGIELDELKKLLNSNDWPALKQRIEKLRNDQRN